VYVFFILKGIKEMAIQSKGAALAASAALMALSMSAGAVSNPTGNPGLAVAATEQVHCYGVNSCKGKSDCKTAASGCKGMNSCKGHGFKAMDAKQCLETGGIIADITK
jgi:hypothetical protein